MTFSTQGARRHRRSTTAIKQALRDLRGQLALFIHQVSVHLDLKDIDLECLDLINRHGPLSPTALARHTELHPATLTGIMDRLERGNWITRERNPDATDRRAVAIHALRDRNAELFRLLAGMNTAMDQVCAQYTETQLDLIADFLHRTASAGRESTDELGKS